MRINIFDNEMAKLNEKPIDQDPIAMQAQAIDAEERESQLKKSMYATKDKDPKRQAQVSNLARELSLPSEVVERNYDMLAKEHSSKVDTQGLAVKNPSLTKWLSNPENAALAKKEIELLKRTERAANAFRNQSEFNSYVDDLGNAGSAGFSRLNSSFANLRLAYGLGDADELAQTIAESNKKAQKIQARAPDYQKEFMEMAGKEMEDITQATKLIGQGYDEIMNDNITEGLMNIGEGSADTAIEILDLIYSSAAGKRRLKGLGYTIAENLPYSLPAIGIGTGAALSAPVVGGGILVTSALGAAGTFLGSAPVEIGAEIDSRAGESGVDMTDPQQIKDFYKNSKVSAEVIRAAERKGITTAGFESATFLLGGVLGKTASRTARGVGQQVIKTGKGVLRESTGEVLGEFAGQVAADGVENANFGEAVFEGVTSLGQSVGQAIITGEVIGLRETMSPDPNVAAQEVATRVEQSLTVINQAGVLKELGDSVAATEDTSSVPGKVEELIHTAIDDGDAPVSVYFQEDDFDSYWSSKEKSPIEAAEELLGSREAYVKAKETGQPIEIPVAKLIEMMAKDEGFGEFVDLSRSAPDAMNAIEANAYNKSVPGLLKKLSEEAQGIDESAQTDEFKKSLSAVRQDIEKQLRDAGFSANDARAQAKLIEAQVSTRAQRMGVDPMELFKKRNFQVRRGGESQVVEGDRSFDQSTAKDLRDKIKQIDTDAAKKDPEFNYSEQDFQSQKNDLLEKAEGSVQGWLVDQDFVNRRKLINIGMPPAVKEKSLEWISSKTQTRIINGERYFLMHRGMRQTEFVNRSPRNVVNSYGSWTPIVESALQIGEEYADGEDVRFISAWISENDIKSVPLIFADMSSDFVAEGEVIVDEGFALNAGGRVTPQEMRGRRESLLTQKESDQFINEFASRDDVADLRTEESVEKFGTEKGLSNEQIESLKYISTLGISEFTVDANNILKKLQDQGVISDVLTNEDVDTLPSGGVTEFLEKQKTDPYIYKQYNQSNLGFHSRLQQTIDQKIQGKSATVEQVRAATKEMKPEEVEWSGLNEFLKGKKKVDKQELMDFLAANQLQIEEVVLGDATGDPLIDLMPDDFELMDTEHDDRNDLDASYRLNVPQLEEFDVEHVDLDVYKDGEHEANINGNAHLLKAKNLDDAAAELQEILSDNFGIRFGDQGSRETKYQKWTLPGGENYREVLFTLPETGVDKSEINRLEAEYENANDQAKKAAKEKSDIIVEFSTLFAKENADMSEDARRMMFKEVRNKIEFAGEGRRRPEIDENQQKSVDEFMDSDQFSDELKALFMEAVLATKRQTGLGFKEYQLRSQLRDAQNNISGKDYTSSHFDQKNIVAHVRLNDRTDKDGNKVLFVEEIQSDWHQDGRKQGYKGDVANPEQVKAEYDAHVKGLREKYNIPEGDTSIYYKDKSPATDAEMEEMNRLARLVDVVDEGVPDAPFKKTWHEFALKRIMTMAVENGYDKIAWTTGEQQAGRYNQQLEVVDQIVSSDVDENIKDVYVTFDTGEDYNLFVDKKTGKVTDSSGASQLVGKGLDEIIGKELAKRIVDSQGDQTFKGDGLKIGGLGMKGFYDNILVRSAGKLGKKLDSKPVMEKIDIGRTGFANNIYQGPVPSRDVILEIAERSDVRTANQLKDFSDAIHVSGLSVEEASSKLSISSAEAMGGNLVETEARDTVSVHSMPVTDKMKQVVESTGFSLFQDQRGRIIFGRDTTVIELLKNADPSTFLHETGHLFLDDMTEDFADLSARDELTEEQAKYLDDMKIALDWLGVESFDQIENKHHEQFARGFEAYLMEGKAPTRALQKIFSKFRVWLTSVYRSMRNLNVELTKDVRDMMGRMLATEQEINQAQSDNAIQPMFGDYEQARAAGMSKDMATRYDELRQMAQITAEEEMTRRLMADWKREQQKFWKKERKIMRETVEPEVDKLVVFHIREDIKNKTIPKMDKKSLVDEFGKDYVQNNLRGQYTPEGGVDYRMVAEMYGYTDAARMVNDLAMYPKKKDYVDQVTDQRMHQQFPDVLTDMDSVEEMAIEAAYNENYDKLRQLEHDFILSQDPTLRKRLLAKIGGGLSNDAMVRERAKEAVDQINLLNLKPHNFRRLAAKYRRQAMAAALKGDFESAMEMSHKERLNMYMYDEAKKYRDQQKKDLKFVRERINKNDKDLAKTKDMNFIIAARAILAKFGLSQADNSAAEILAPIAKYDPDVFKTVMALVNAVDVSPREFKYLTVEQATQVMETVRALYELAGNSMNVIIDGKKVEIAQATAELTEQAQIHVKKVPKEKYNRAATNWEKTKREVLSALSLRRRLEAWVDTMDMGDPGGAFRKYIFNPVSDASEVFTKKMAEMQAKFLEEVQKLDLGNGNPIEAGEIGYQFQNKAELIGALMHIGNESNLRKLLLGRGWAVLNEDGKTLDVSKWNQFLTRMHDQGILTKADYDFVQSIWDMMDSVKPELQKANKRIHGFYFNEIEGQAFETPFGTYRGGYAPAAIDTTMIEAEGIASKQEIQQFIDDNPHYTMPHSGGDGFTKGRIENAAYPLVLDIQLFNRHMAQVLKFAYIKPAVVDAVKITNNPEFKNFLETSIERDIVKNVINPALNRADKQRFYNLDSPSLRALDKFAKFVRRRITLQIMFGNVKNVVEQSTGLITASQKVKPSLIRQGLAQYMKNSKGMTDLITEKSLFMDNRLKNQAFEIRNKTDEFILQPNKYQKAQEWFRANAYVLQSVFQNQIDPSVWYAAYNQSVQEGKSEKQAVMFADSVIRNTMGTMRPFDVSGIESLPFIDMLQQFMGYFNMMANTAESEFRKIILSDMSMQQKYAAAFYVYFATVAAPAIISAALGKAFQGGLDADDDGEYADDLLDVMMWSQVSYLGAMVPIIGPAVTSGLQAFDDKPWNDRVSASPTISALQTISSVPASLIKAGNTRGTRRKAVRDSFTALGVLTGLPGGPVSKPINYLMDINSGDANPSGPIDFTRGMITGQPGVN